MIAILAVFERFPILSKLGAALLVAFSLWGAYGYWHHKVYQEGYGKAEIIYKAREAKANSDALDAKAKADAAIKLKQADLDSVLAKLATKEQEFINEQIISATYKADLAAGRKRLRVLISAGSNCSARDNKGSSIAGMDSLSEISAELDPQVAAGLVSLTDTGDQAIKRLNACIEAYSAVEKAVNKTP